MTLRLWYELNWIQSDLNRKIVPVHHADAAWHYAIDGSGNCVQFALEKRRELIRRGWPPGALPLATAVTPAGVGHLVLVVVSTDGDWVLDNLRNDVVRWEELPYHWIKRQQDASMLDWVSVAANGGDR
jgi:predicted transglutaminase-like cysteine proteinase